MTQHTACLLLSAFPRIGDALHCAVQDSGNGLTLETTPTGPAHLGALQGTKFHVGAGHTSLNLELEFMLLTAISLLKN